MTKTIKLLFFLPLIMICVFLGFWQIDRGSEKQVIYTAFTDKLKNSPIDYKYLEEYPDQFTRTIINGRYITDKQFLLDNTAALHPKCRQQRCQQMMYIIFHIRQQEN